MEYTLEMIKYDMFLSEQMEEQAKLELYIEECLLISENKNNIANMKILTESFADKIKSGIKKIIETISKMWGKFLEAMNTLIKRDKGYLEKYKDVILKKKPIDATLTMYNYPEGVKSIINAHVPMFNYGTMKEQLKDDNTFISAYFRNYVGNLKPPFSFPDAIKAKFRGGDKQIQIKSTQINMTDIYNYCYNYQSLKNGIQKDIDNIQKAALAAVDLVDKMVKDGEIQKESENIFLPNQYLSEVYNGFINEVEKNYNNNSPQQTTTQKDTTNSPGDTNVAKVNKNIDGEADKNDQDIKDTAKDNTAKDNTDRINRYMRLCGEFLGAKLSVTEEIYKEYMSIIKSHVRDHVGSNDKTTNKAADVGSSYGNSDNSDSNKNNDGNPKQTESTNKSDFTINPMKWVGKTKSKE